MMTLELVPPQRALFIAAHPDDIEFAAAGTAAKWAQAGTRVRYVLVTSGDIGSLSPGITHEELARTREAEQRAAARVIGMDESDVEVAIEAGRLAIRGEKRDEREETGASYSFRERSFGSFERTFTLPANAEEEGVEASFNKGVLTVTVPCKAGGEDGTRKIEVTAG